MKKTENMFGFGGSFVGTVKLYSSHNFMDDSCSDDIYHAVKCRNLNEEKQWHGGSVFYLLLCTGIGLSDYCGMLCISGTFQI